jgi:hypothetical protein
MNKLKFTLLSLVLSIVSIPTMGQDRPMYEVHSMMVYNFLKYIEWPAEAKSGDFVIGVYGDNNVFETLNKWYGSKDKMGQKIVIKKFNSSAEVGNCHILYLGSSKSNDFDGLKTKLTGTTTLMITDRKGLGEKGSGINFKMEGNKLKFEMNQSAMEAARLKVSSQLSSMAIVI